MPRDDSETSKPWSIAELASGCMVVLGGLTYIILLAVLPSGPATPFERFGHETIDTPWTSYVFAVLQTLIGVGIVAHSLHRLRRSRLTHRAAPPGLRPVENAGRPAIPAAL